MLKREREKRNREGEREEERAGRVGSREGGREGEQALKKDYIDLRFSTKLWENRRLHI